MKLKENIQKLYNILVIARCKSRKEQFCTSKNNENLERERERERERGTDRQTKTWTVRETEAVVCNPQNTRWMTYVETKVSHNHDF